MNTLLIIACRQCPFQTAIERAIEVLSYLVDFTPREYLTPDDVTAMTSLVQALLSNRSAPYPGYDYGYRLTHILNSFLNSLTTSPVLQNMYLQQPQVIYK